jgi:site-specific DNA recombinase
VEFRVIRPVFRTVLKDLQRGISKSGHRIHGLMLADIDRLTRDNGDLERAIDAVNYCKRPIIELTRTLDLSTNYGQQFARNMVTQKNGQSADTAQRLRNFHQARRERGIPTGGTRPFGWMDDKRTLHPDESDLLRAAIADVIGERPRSAVTKEWNERGITTTRGSKWNLSNFTTMLRNPRMAGYQSVLVARDPEDPDCPRYPVVLLGAAGKPVMGQFEAMITPEQWTALVEILGETPGRGSGSNARVYLCVGTLRCGKCEHRLRASKAQPSDRKPAGFFYYTCPAKSAGGCGGIKIPGQEVDEAVAELVIAKWEAEAATPGRTRTEAPKRWGRAGELGRVFENMAALKAARTAAQPISAERYYADLAAYEAEERALIADRNAFVRRAAKDSSRPVDLRADWHSGRMSFEEKKAYIERVLTAVIVAPAGRVGPHTPARNRLTPIPAPVPEG